MWQLCRYAWMATVFLPILTEVTFSQNRLDFVTLKKDAQVFERIVDERLRQAFSDPFAIVVRPQAFYLQGYGVVVSFQLNINRGRIRTPFGEIDAPTRYNRDEDAVDGGQRRKQFQRIKEIVIDCLADYSGSIKQLGGHDRVSISAQIEDRNELNPSRRRMVLVVTTTRDDVDLLGMRRIELEEFRQRLHILEY